MSRVVNRIRVRLAAATLATFVGVLLAAGSASAAAPSVVTGAAKEVTRTSMTLCGTVNAEGEATTFHFVYEHYESGWQAATTASESAGEGTSAVEECTNVTGLIVETRYKFKIVAKNASGEKSGYSKYESTSPAVEEVKTEAATNVTRLGAMSEVTLNGVLAPNGYDTHYYFEYQLGEKPLYRGSPENEVVPALPGADAGEESKLEHVSVKMEVPTNVEIRYILVGVNQFGSTWGNPERKALAPAVEGVETFAPTEVTASSVVLHGSLEPNGYDTHWQFECRVSGGKGGVLLLGPSPAADAGTSSGPKSVEAQLTTFTNGDPLAGNTHAQCHLVASNALGTDEGTQVEFTTPKAAPAIAGGAQPEVSDATAALHATLETQHEATTYWVEYVDAAEYAPAEADPYEAGGVSDETVAEATPFATHVLRGVTGLAPSTTYHYRFVAENATGITYGPDETFTTEPLTPPVVSTGAASGISATGATIAGTVNPEGLKTSYEFQIGETTSYGGAQIFGNAGEGGGEEAVSTTLSYLVPGTTYHYRVVATNVDGTTYGPDMTFTTPGIASPISQPASTPLLNVTLGTTFPTEKVSAGGGKSKKGKSGKAKKLAKALKRCMRKHGKKKRRACKRRVRRRLAKGKASARRGHKNGRRHAKGARRHRRHG